MGGGEPLGIEGLKWGGRGWEVHGSGYWEGAERRSDLPSVQGQGNGFQTRQRRRDFYLWRPAIEHSQFFPQVVTKKSMHVNLFTKWRWYYALQSQVAVDTKK